MNNNLFVKAAVVVAITLALTIPLLMIRGVIDERGDYRDAVAQDIARTWTGNQLVLGPVLSLPYEVEEEIQFFSQETQKYETETQTRQDTAYLIADNLTLDGNVAIEKRWRGIYSVPVYASELDVRGEFSTARLARLQAEIPGFARWLDPELNLVISDVRGIASRPELEWNAQSIDFASASKIPNLSSGLHATLPAMPTDATVLFSLRLDLRGSEALRFAAFAQDTQVALRSAWPHPKFDGSFLPANRTVTADGFEASWQTSAFSTGAQRKLAECVAGQCAPLLQTSFGVDFIETADIYQKITRATKYGMLFIVLTFVAFSLTETLGAVKLHPMQYALVGFALAIFYLLLISLSEHVNFALSYAVATVSCVTLIGVYLAGALRSARRGFAYGGGIGLLYAMLFAILRSEDFALLMGTLLLFAMLAAVMLLTRRFDWYSLPKTLASKTPVPAASDAG